MSAQEKEPYEEMSKIDELRYLEEVRQGDGLTMELFCGGLFFLKHSRNHCFALPSDGRIQVIKAG